MHRFIVKPSDIKNNSVELDAKESHHAVKVLRLEVGDAVQVLDGKGLSHSGFISSTTGGHVLVSLNPNAKEKLGNAVRVTLACSLIKAERMEWLIEKACELGVTEIIPLATERSVVRLDEDARISKQKRWQKIVEASCKQCGLSEIPQIRPVQKWKDFLVQSKNYDLRLIPNLERPSQSLKKILSQKTAPHKSVVVAIGPEGDFTGPEVELAVQAGFEVVSLGELIMRSETAALYSLSALLFHYGHKQ